MVTCQLVTGNQIHADRRLKQRAPPRTFASSGRQQTQVGNRAVREPARVP